MLGNESLRETFAPGPRSADVAREYLGWLRQARRRTALTVYQYAGKLESFLDWIEHDSLEVVTATEIEAWLARPRSGRGRGGPGAAATVSKEVSLIRGLYRYANARGLCISNPTALLYAPAPKNENPRPVPDALWEPLWAVADLPAEARVVLGLGYFCGLRRAEIAGLQVSQINLRQRQLVGFARKGGGDDVLDFGELLGVIEDELPNLIPGGAPSFLEPLEQVVLGTHTSLLLDWTMTAPRTRAKHQRPEGVNDPQLIYRRLRRWLRGAGLAETFTPHQLRHSFVTNLLRAGMPIHLVSRLANHSSISVTMRYAKVGGQDLREWRASARRRSVLEGMNRW